MLNPSLGWDASSAESPPVLAACLKDMLLPSFPCPSGYCSVNTWQFIQPFGEGIFHFCVMVSWRGKLRDKPDSPKTEWHLWYHCILRSPKRTPVEHITSAALRQTGCKGVDCSALECNFWNSDAEKSLFCRGLQRNWRPQLFHLSVPKVCPDCFSFSSQKERRRKNPPTLDIACYTRNFG